MLTSSERLRRGSVFKRAYNNRMVVGTPILKVYFLPKHKQHRRPGGVSGWRPLAGFVVSKSISKSACRRNRARRRMREAYRLLRKAVYEGKRADIDLSNWYALVFVAQEGVIAANYAQIKEALESCLARASSRKQ